MTSRTDVLARLPGVQPIAVTQSEAAALCGMSVPTFQSLCPIKGAHRGRGVYYPYEEVKRWFREWWLAETGDAGHAGGPSDDDLLDRLDDKNAA